MVPLLFRSPTELRSFTGKQGLALLLHPEDARITVFASRLGVADEYQRHSRTIWYSQFTYAGAQIYESEITLHNDDSLCTTFKSLNNPFVPVGGLGLFKVCVMSDRAHLLNTRWLQFDERLHQFTEPRPLADQGRMWADSTLFWWKDTFFSSLQPHDFLPVGVVSALTHLGTGEEPRSESLMVEKLEFLSHSNVLYGPHMILLDDRYVVRGFKHSFHILCYQESASYPQDDSAFFGVGYVDILDVQRLARTP
jgi:hypothetical protein